MNHRYEEMLAWQEWRIAQHRAADLDLSLAVAGVTTLIAGTIVLGLFSLAAAILWITACTITMATASRVAHRRSNRLFDTAMEASRKAANQETVSDPW